MAKIKITQQLIGDVFITYEDNDSISLKQGNDHVIIQPEILKIIQQTVRDNSKSNGIVESKEKEK